MSITLIRQETISLAIRNPSFRHPVEGRRTFRDISPVVIQANHVNLFQSIVYKMHLPSSTREIEIRREVVENWTVEKQGVKTSWHPYYAICLLRWRVLKRENIRMKRERLLVLCLRLADRQEYSRYNDKGWIHGNRTTFPERSFFSGFLTAFSG